MVMSPRRLAEREGRAQDCTLTVAPLAAGQTVMSSERPEKSCVDSEGGDQDRVLEA